MYRGDYYLSVDPTNPSLSRYGSLKNKNSWADNYYSWCKNRWDPNIKYVQAPLSIPSTKGYINADSWGVYNTPIWPLIIILVLVYLIWTEYGSQDCRNQDCNNRAKIVYESYTDNSEFNNRSGVEFDSNTVDSNEEIIDKISTNVMQNHTIVTWRRSIIAAILISLVILFIFCKEFPHGFTVLLTVFFVFMAVQISANWFQAHWWLFNDYKIDRSLQTLRQRVAEYQN